MISDPGPLYSPWHDACLAAAMLAIAPHAMGGVAVRARSGPVRDHWIALLQELLAPGTPVCRLPPHIGDDRLIGGLDLAATLDRGRPVAERGLLAAADGGLLIIPSAERLDRGRAARIASALDTGSMAIERDGLSLKSPARFGAVALDERVELEEALPPALQDRLGLWISLEGLSIRDAGYPDDLRESVAVARCTLAHTVYEMELPDLFCATAQALGISSLRAVVFALLAARISAALNGRIIATVEDAELAARLVLSPRATRLPAEAAPPPEEDTAPPQDPSPQPPDAAEEGSSSGHDDKPATPQMDDDLEILLAAAQAAIPSALLATLSSVSAPGPSASSMGRAGATRVSTRRGRPAGVRRGEPRNGNVLNLIETLRAAAPHQSFRRRARNTEMADTGLVRVEVRASDFRISRFKQKTNTTTIFVVDASGSSALHRLAEAKGAVELILSECYVRRDSVALIAFRGKTAETLLPPTRSLTRARRSLAALPGGGGTPLAAAIASALDLAAGEKRKGLTPSVVLLTDGRANIDRAGTASRTGAMTDARAAAEAFRSQGIPAMLIDISPRRNREAQDIAQSMGATYVPMPFADSKALSHAVLASRSG